METDTKQSIEEFGSSYEQPLISKSQIDENEEPK